MTADVQSQRLSFENGRGERLSALLDRPGDGEIRAYAVFAHCFTCNKLYKGIRNICRVLCTQGIAVLRFDFTGLGESEGDFTETVFSDNVQDIVRAARFVEDGFEAPALLIGHSLGGAAALMAAAQVPSCRAVATIAAPSEPAHVLDHFPDLRAEIARRGEAEIRVGGIEYRINRRFVEDLDACDLGGAIGQLDRALLILHSPSDKTVDIASAARIFSRARHPKSFVSLGQADHLLMDGRDAGYAGRMIAAWCEPYVNG